MAVKILMPALSPTMESGKIAQWLVAENATVASGDILAEIETDKAIVELEAIDDGTIGKILIEAGPDQIDVNRTIAVLLTEGEDASAIEAALSDAEPSAAVEAAASETAAEDTVIPLADHKVTQDLPKPVPRRAARNGFAARHKFSRYSDARSFARRLGGRNAARW